MFFYQFNKNKKLYELRKASSFTLAELSKISEIPMSTLKEYENMRLKEISKDHRIVLIPIFENEIGVI